MAVSRLTPLIACLALALSSFVTVANAAERLALVVGNSAYKAAPLPNSVNDSAVISEALEDSGFQVVHVQNADRREMRAAFRAFAKSATDAGRNTVALFFYAGHGIQADGRNYLIPIGADLRSQADLEYEAIDAQWVLDLIGESRAGVNIVVLDACRNNPFQSSARGVSRGLAQMSAPTGSLVAYSTAPGQTAEDGDGGNSPFTRALASAIRKPGLKIEEVMKETRREVFTTTASKQVPWVSSSLIGDFYFSRPESEPRRATPTVLAALEQPKRAAPQSKPVARGLGGPSFNCEKATTRVEKLICDVAPLATVDGDLGRAYKAARAGLSKADQTRLRDRQRAWIKSRDAHCVRREVDRKWLADCLYRMTEDRVAFLKNY